MRIDLARGFFPDSNQAMVSNVDALDGPTHRFLRAHPVEEGDDTEERVTFSGMTAADQGILRAKATRLGFNLDGALASTRVWNKLTEAQIRSYQKKFGKIQKTYKKNHGPAMRTRETY
ncbi:hypothetical protein PHMEG_00032857 [Phytophthora megakarya]|uniref:RxLR effector protein n=1 Tax=Phytophthora megakarya TaxID=4795 RepID=A0A225UX14_9STRA|nr:hypothetical protein PHMEG_00032857 [Phytophthora megakarya]